jgi:hypothetical protein
MDTKKGKRDKHFRAGIAALIGAILGIMAYTNNWLG